MKNMKSIWKYPLKVTDEQRVEITIGSDILSVLNQNEQIVMYVAVSDSPTIIARQVCIRGTGHPAGEIPPDFLGSVSLHGGSLVFHVFVDHSERF